MTRPGNGDDPNESEEIDRRRDKLRLPVCVAELGDNRWEEEGEGDFAFNNVSFTVLRRERNMKRGEI